VQIQAQLLALDLGQWQADLDLSKNTPTPFGVSLAFGARCGHNGQRVCYDFLGSGHMLTSFNVLVMFYFY
jgi:hypothetical protein